MEGQVTFGAFDYFDKIRGHHITVKKVPHFLVKNIVFGTMEIDIDGPFAVHNITTGEYAECEFIQKKSNTQNSRVAGKAFDA